jgi:hypothetical protein
MTEISLDHKIKSAVAAWREKDYGGMERLKTLFPPAKIIFLICQCLMIEFFQSKTM